MSTDEFKTGIQNKLTNPALSSGHLDLSSVNPARYQPSMSEHRGDLRPVLRVFRVSYLYDYDQDGSVSRVLDKERGEGL